jgi:hypothetical protein
MLAKSGKLKSMPNWVNALLFAVLVVTIPFTMILRILLQLPKAAELCHRRWPPALNLVLIGMITAYVSIFIRNAYYARETSVSGLLLQFVIAALAYGFGLVLILRQYTGVYPEFIVTTGAAGLGIRKIAYRNIADVEEIWRGHGETQFRIQTIYETSFRFTLPTRSVPALFERLEANRAPD